MGLGEWEPGALGWGPVGLEDLEGLKGLGAWRVWGPWCWRLGGPRDVEGLEDLKGVGNSWAWGSGAGGLEGLGCVKAWAFGWGRPANCGGTWEPSSEKLFSLRESFGPYFTHKSLCQ